MLKRIGIQKRIMAYVAVGLLLLFGVFAYLGLEAVERATKLVFEERLAIAQSVAAAVSRDFAHLVADVEERTGTITPNSGRSAIGEVLRETLFHLAKVDSGSFSFLTVTSVLLVDPDGRLLAGAPEGSVTGDERVLRDLVAQASVAPSNPGVFYPEGGHPGQFVSASLSLKDSRGETWAWILANTESISSSQPFVPFGLLRSGAVDSPARAEPLPEQTQYHLELLAASGVTILGIGADENVGRQSWHYPLVKDLMAAKRSDVLLHKVADTSESRDHVMAVVPVPLSDVYLILEQDRDVALALPIEYRRRLILLASLGFVAALLVAWVATRHIVKPTKELTAAAGRMARGDLSTPLEISAQDEIGVLAENLDVMRQQLRNALDRLAEANRELESRVKERTSRLHELVGEVFSAHEEERHRIARELHDETAQAATAVTAMLDSVTHRGSNLTPQQASTLREARQIVTGVVEGIRRLIYALRPVALEDMGLEAALRGYAQESLERLGIAVHVETKGPEKEVQDHLELVMYRIGQEAVNNVGKHARAQNVWITIVHGDSTLSLTVRDDGIGFDPNASDDAKPRTEGIGLAEMRERVDLVSGRMTVESAPGRGTTIRVEVPTLDYG